MAKICVSEAIHEAKCFLQQGQASKAASSSARQIRSVVDRRTPKSRAKSFGIPSRFVG
jgi:hypothetical protein